MAKMTNITTPIGELQWVSIDTPRTNPFNNNEEYQASVICSAEEAQDTINQLKQIFKDEHPSKKPQSMGYKTLDDGRVEFRFKTKAQLSNGSQKVVKCVDAYKKPFPHKANIGNGSTGRISGAAGVYSQGANSGVSLYLNAVQVLEWQEYEADDGFDEVDGYESYSDTQSATDTSSNSIPQQEDEFDF